ncbi:MAG: RhuM [Candidatus Woesebacteria bacterium GW2011_GWA1_39_21]|uniref:RhuM n=1 Tax=Candidatus Woesebacteria bacterium GW2011_GWA1_39_21 TaxID=1618550 RepID=A0A0G0N0F4_9BACT|nr:MAG: RhuM [Candidatus Woesebacteria bacterium GW2011_GWA1_39_21]
MNEISMVRKKLNNKAVIFQAKSGAIELRGDFAKDTIWATQAQIADIFGVKRPAITKHFQNIFKSKELNEKAVCSILEHTAEDGKKYKTQFYDLDAIISVGYRINSKKATEFRIWATKILRQHITKGYTINPKVIKNNYAEFQKAIKEIKHFLPTGTPIDHQSVLDLISAFAETWLSLDAYDKDELTSNGTTKEISALTSDQLSGALSDFKNSLMKKGDTAELFGVERVRGNIAGIVGNIMQSFDGKTLYATAEERAAHLFYFIVKDHPFIDGNKRNGAYSFVWFLHRAGILDKNKITPSALTALTLFVAESNSKNKDRIIKLVLQLLKK